MEKSCEMKDCDGVASESMYYSGSENRQGHIVPVGKQRLIDVCKGHYYWFQCQMYGSE
jgi:hypothetical protein